MSKEKFALPDRLKGTMGDVWAKTIDFTADLVNLSVGVPNFLPPREYMECLRDAVLDETISTHQYCNSAGHPRLRNTLARMYSPILGQDLDIEKNIVVTLGAKEALVFVLQGALNQGDEVILIEPFFTPYRAAVEAAGGVCVSLPLRPTPSDSNTGSRSSAEWTLSREELATTFSPRTKLFILNTPNNPLGKVFTREEMTTIADLCIQNDVVCVSDDVYEYLVFDGGSSTKIATIPGMWERTITLGSIGKMLSVTGWRTGWAIGPAHLIRLVEAAHRAGSVSTPTPMQVGVAKCLELELSRAGNLESYRISLAAKVETNRDKLANALLAAGLRPIIPQGGYFLIVDATALANKLADDGRQPRDADVINFLAKEKLVVLPMVGFYTEEFSYMGKFLLRLCIVKDTKTIDRAVDIIKNLNAAVDQRKKQRQMTPA